MGIITVLTHLVCCKDYLVNICLVPGMVPQAVCSVCVCCCIFIAVVVSGAHWWFRVKNVFVLVQVLLFPRGAGSHSTVRTAASGAVWG